LIVSSLIATGSGQKNGLGGRIKGQTTFLVSINLEDDSIYSTIREEIRGLDIGVLINNVGMSYQYPETFDKVEDNENFLNDMIRCNVNSAANLTQMILPGLLL
jgi:17beta-estradiol 17-dehydrogenase / very-long-chain 3-oxoacyl-CoA reductase